MLVSLDESNEFPYAKMIEDMLERFYNSSTTGKNIMAMPRPAHIQIESEHILQLERSINANPS